jgi:hypothetical protein
MPTDAPPTFEETTEITSSAPSWEETGPYEPVRPEQVNLNDPRSFYARYRLEHPFQERMGITGPENPEEAQRLVGWAQGDAPFKFPRFVGTDVPSKIAAPILNFPASVAESFETPMGWAPLALPGKFVRPAFAALAGKGAVEAGIQAYREKDLQKASEAALDAALAAILLRRPRVVAPGLQGPPATGESLDMPGGARPIVATPGETPLGPEAPNRVRKPEVPETPAEQRLSVIEEIRQKNARTRAEIQKLFKERGLTNEQAAALRNAAWGKPEPAKPAETPQEETEEVSAPAEAPQAQAPAPVVPEAPVPPVEPPKPADPVLSKVTLAGQPLTDWMSLGSEAELPGGSTLESMAQRIGVNPASRTLRKDVFKALKNENRLREIFKPFEPAVAPLETKAPEPAPAPTPAEPAADAETVTLYRGDDGSGGAWFTSKPDKAASFGKRVRAVQVSKAEAEAAKSAAEKQGQGGDTYFLTRENADKAKPIEAPPAKVEALDDSITLTPALQVGQDIITGKSHAQATTFGAGKGIDTVTREGRKEGFLGSDGKFYTRAEGAEIFKKQTGKDPSKPGELHSEDLAAEGMLDHVEKLQVTKAKALESRDPTLHLDYSPEDLSRYLELKPKTIPKTIEEANSPEFQKAWKEFEILRNKYNGNPPKQLLTAKAKPVEAETPPKAPHEMTVDEWGAYKFPQAKGSERRVLARMDLWKYVQDALEQGKTVNPELLQVFKAKIEGAKGEAAEPGTNLPKPGTPEYDSLPMGAKGALHEHEINQRIIDTGMQPTGKKATKAQIAELVERQKQVLKNFEAKLSKPAADETVPGKYASEIAHQIVRGNLPEQYLGKPVIEVSPNTVLRGSGESTTYHHYVTVRSNGKQIWRGTVSEFEGKLDSLYPKGLLPAGKLGKNTLFVERLDAPKSSEAPAAAVAKVEAQVEKVAATEGQRAAKDVKTELAERVQAELDKLPQDDPEHPVRFTDPKTYSGKKRIEVYGGSNEMQGSIRIQQGRTGNWDVVIRDLAPGKDKSIPVEIQQTIASDLPLQEAKARAQEQAAHGNPWHTDKRIFQGNSITQVKAPKGAKTLSPPESVTIDIPGDGTFKVPKTRSALERMLARVKALSTSTTPPKGFTESLPTAAQGKAFAEEARQQPDLSGPGSPSATQGPDPVTLGLSAGNPALNRIQRQFSNFYRGVAQLFSRRGTKQDLMQLTNAADNLPRIAGHRAGNSIRLRTTEPEQDAITFLMQAMKHEDPKGHLETRAQDMETAAQVFLRDGQKLEAQAAIEAAKHMRYAAENFNRLLPTARAVKAKFDRQIDREAAAGINVNYEDWYVPQRHDLDLLQGDRPIVLGHSRAAGTATGFKKAKVYPDYATAIEQGFVPRRTNIADLLEHRVNQGERLIARKALFDRMMDMHDTADGKPLAMPIPRRVIHRPDGTVDVQESVPRGYQPFDVIPGYRLAVHEGYSRLVNALTGTSQISESAIVGTLQDIAGLEKHLALALDSFHASRTLQAELAITHKLSLGDRQRLGRALVEYNTEDLNAAVRKGEITQEMADYIRTPIPLEVNGRKVSMTPAAIVKLGIDNGVNLARFNDALYRDWLRNIPITGAVNRWVFDKMTRSAITHGFLAEFQRVARTNPELNATQVARRVSSDINVMFGNLQKESIFRNPSVSAINQILFLAPKWVEALVRREARAARQGVTAAAEIVQGRPSGPPLTRATETGRETFTTYTHAPRLGTAGRGIGTGLSAYFVATQVLNLITRHHLTFQNQEKGHKLDAWIPDFSGKTKGYFLSPLSVFGEITHDVLRYLREKPDAATAINQIGANKLGNLGRAIGVAVMGRDPATGEKLIGTSRRAMSAATQLVPVPISLSQASRAIASKVAPGIVSPPPPGSVQRQVAASLGFKTEPAGSAQQQIYSAADKWKAQSTNAKIRADVERRLKEDFGPSDYRDLRTALVRDDFTSARREYKELRKTKDAAVINRAMRHPHPFTGSEAAERSFLRSLSDEEKSLYRQALQERKDIYRKYRQMLNSSQ